MDLKSIRDELQRLLEIADSWKSPADITALEKDLVLEKLRRLYETLRFEVMTEELPMAAGTDADEVDIDLGEVLSLGLSNEDDMASLRGTNFFSNGSRPRPSVAVPVLSAMVPEQAVTFPQVMAVREFEEVHATFESVSDSADEELSASALADQQGVAHQVASAPQAAVWTEPVVSPEADSSEEFEVVDNSTFEPVSASDTTLDSAAGLQLGSLFGAEEQSLRHRHKQRVIMSLYDTTPAGSHSESTPQPVVDSAPAAFRPEPTPEAFDLSAEPVMPMAAVVPESKAFAVAEDDLEFREMAIEDSQEPTTVQGSVLGDVINHDVQTLADTIAPPRHATSDMHHSERLVDLRRGIGINDKFLLIRDLFGGDSRAFDAAIGVLNDAESLDDCMIYIAENYSWNPNSDGAKFIMELIERKFS